MSHGTLESAIPHADGDVSAVSWVKSILERLVDCLSVQQHGIVERADEAVHLHENMQRFIQQSTSSSTHGRLYTERQSHISRAGPAARSIL